MSLLFNYDIEENDIERRKEIEASLNRSLLTLEKKEEKTCCATFLGCGYVVNLLICISVSLLIIIVVFIIMEFTK